ncbi:MAG: hypothetical protein RMJ53_07665 [Chitinophagales bacterium]|nr:hypothetical protein [Chitinophagales bacterium]
MTIQYSCNNTKDTIYYPLRGDQEIKGGIVFSKNVSPVSYYAKMRLMNYSKMEGKIDSLIPVLPNEILIVVNIENVIGSFNKYSFSFRDYFFTGLNYYNKVIQEKKVFLLQDIPTVVGVSEVNHIYTTDYVVEIDRRKKCVATKRVPPASLF